MVESLDAIVAYGTVRGSRRSKYFASEAVLELDGLVAYQHLSGAGRWTVGSSAVGSSSLDFYLTLNVPSFSLGGPGYDPGITEGSLEQI